MGVPLPAATAYKRCVGTRSPLRRFPAAATVGAALLVGGCGGTQAKPRSAQPATLHVRQEWDGGGLYVEGAYSYLRVERNGSSVLQVRLSDMKIPRAAIHLDPGSYRLVSFQRPCDGNCGTLDSPTDQCSRAVQVEADAVLEAVVRLSPGEGCTIEEESPID